ncbi:MAG: ATP-binding cassette domain-containing protein [Opitutales bacterium]|nr:ATP-binding cassette domain-containing protein [Opitutales bacterium]
MKNAKKAKEILEMQNLSLYSFESGEKILDRISLTVENGQRWVLLGANGAGKSSLISAVCGFSMPDECLLRVSGFEYSKDNWSKVREKIALIGTHLHREINSDEKVVDTIISGKFAMINFWGKITKNLILEAYEKMKQMGIEHLIDSSWKFISQGERQKVLIARSLMTKPDVIFLDEPCSALDPVARRNFVRFLDKLGRKKTIPAIIMATHYLEEIPPSFTHAIILKKVRYLHLER